MTGGAQQALSAAINLHHGDEERARCVCDSRYVTANMVEVSMSVLCAHVQHRIMFVKISGDSDPLKKQKQTL